MRLQLLQSRWGRASALAALGVIVAACTVVVDEDRPPPRPGGPPGGFCTREYAPVCGQRGRDRETFSNACMARSDGYRVLYRGRCERDRPGRPGRPDRPTAACPMIYAPVCARRGPVVRTFGNSCQANADGYRIVRRGPC